MLTNLGLASLVDRIARDAGLRDDLAKDFDGTLDRSGMSLSGQDRDALRAAWQYIREFGGPARDARIIAGWGIGC
ncbi:MAG: hypothetical protein FJZ01_25105 [Candidatus Sericytochromatia bacterium]|nr:hypothetical protein [Candidatus Tanganyikabacteria bacterium]